MASRLPLMQEDDHDRSPEGRIDSEPAVPGGPARPGCCRGERRPQFGEGPTYRREGVMRVDEIMTNDVVTASTTTTVIEAADRMRRKHIRHLVVRKDGRVVGVVSDRDVNVPSVFGERLTEVMTEPAVTIGPNDTVRTAADRMRRRGVSSLPVVDRGELVGI